MIYNSCVIFFSHYWPESGRIWHRRQIPVSLSSRGLLPPRGLPSMLRTSVGYLTILFLRTGSEIATEYKACFRTSKLGIARLRNA